MRCRAANAVKCDDSSAETARNRGTLWRVRSNQVRWQPRTLDLDILSSAMMVIQKPVYSTASAYAERAFVLVPLSELGHELEIPGRVV